MFKLLKPELILHSQSVCLPLKVAAIDTAKRACALLQVGDLIEKEAVLYLHCALECPVFKRWNVEQLLPVAAICLYLTIRMHQLPVSIQCLLLAVGQQAQFSVNLFWQVAKAVNQHPPAVDYSKFAVLVMADLHDEEASTKMQVSYACQHLDQFTGCSAMQIVSDWTCFKMISCCCCVSPDCAELRLSNAVNALASPCQTERCADSGCVCQDDGLARWRSARDHCADEPLDCCCSAACNEVPPGQFLDQSSSLYLLVVRYGNA